MGMHVSLGRSHKNKNRVFRLVNPVHDMDMHIFKVTVFIKYAKSYQNIVFYYVPGVFNM